MSFDCPTCDNTETCITDTYLDDTISCGNEFIVRKCYKCNTTFTTIEDFILHEVNSTEQELKGK